MPNPIIPVKAKATHIIPAMTSRAACWSMEKLKLKIRMTMRAKNTMEEIVSRLRSSVTKSFHTIQRMTLKEVIRLQRLDGDFL